MTNSLLYPSCLSVDSAFSFGSGATGSQKEFRAAMENELALEIAIKKTKDKEKYQEEVGIDLFPRSWVAFAEDPMRFPFQYQVHGVCCTYLVLNTQNFHSVLLNIFHWSFIFRLQLMWVGFTSLLTFLIIALFSSLFSMESVFIHFFKAVPQSELSCPVPGACHQPWRAQRMLLPSSSSLSQLSPF